MTLPVIHDQMKTHDTDGGTSSGGMGNCRASTPARQLYCGQGLPSDWRSFRAPPLFLHRRAGVPSSMRWRLACFLPVRAGRFLNFARHLISSRHQLNRIAHQPGSYLANPFHSSKRLSVSVGFDDQEHREAQTQNVGTVFQGTQ